MLLEFKLYKINKESKLFKMVSDYNKLNQFIIVGEDEDCFKVHQLAEKGLILIGGLYLDEAAYSIKKTELTLLGDGVGIDYTEIDIPKEYLTIDLIETIQRLNS